MAEVKDLKIYGSIAKNVLHSFGAAHQKIEKQCESLADKLNSIENKLQATDSEVELNTLFAESKKVREALLKNLIIKNKLEIVISKNEERLELIKTELGEDVEENAVSKKEIEQLLKQNYNETNTTSLGLNEDSVKFVNFEGMLLVVSGEGLNISDGDNLSIILSMDFDKLNMLISMFPTLISTVTVEQLLDSNLRTKLLKSLAAYVFEELKTKTISEINENLGSLLVFKKEITNTFEAYVAGVSNLFKVKIRKHLIERFPEKAEEIISKLNCNEHSMLLPEDVYVPAEDQNKNKTEEGEVNIDTEIDAFLKSLSDNDEEEG